MEENYNNQTTMGIKKGVLYNIDININSLAG
jgi:hypothetical protein